MAGVLLLVVGGFFITLGIICAAGIAGWLLFRNDSRQITAVVPARGKGSPANSSRKKRRRKPGQASRSAARSKMLGLSPLVAAPLLGFQAGIVAKLFIVFAGMSVMLFGGGYVFIPLIQEIVVDP